MDSNSLSRPADHAVRMQALDAERSFIVAAPAGSGKTELLTQRYLKLLGCVAAPEEILAITFTRKAAAEMRLRVLNALALAESRSPPESLLQRDSWQLAREAKAADERHGWKLAEHPARLRIMTIDALNNYLARQLPILSGAGAALDIAGDSSELYAQVSLRLIERLGSGDASSHPVEQLLRHLDNQYDVFAHLLAQELARREYWLDLGLMQFDQATLRERLEAVLNTVIESELTALRQLIPQHLQSEIAQLAAYGASKLHELGTASPLVACIGLAGFPDAKAMQLEQWMGIAELLLTHDGEWRKRIDVKLGFPPKPADRKQALLDLIAALQGDVHLAAQLHLVRRLPAARYTDPQWQVLAALLDVLRLGIAELEIVMRERGEADYAANAIAARRALGSSIEPTDLALRLDYRLRHILVDEFQDTSYGQAQLLGLLTAGWSADDGRSLFCVGDPMQSIYRFRHADVGLFLNLQRQGLNQLQLTPLRLSVNFRASQPVLDWVNKTFVTVLPPRNDAERGAVAFTGSTARELAPTNGGVFIHPLIGASADGRLEEARAIADVIATSLARDTTSRIAVLTPSRSHLQWIIAELKHRQLAYQAVEIDPLAARSAVQDLIALTRALTHLGDRTAWLSILRAPWCGLSLADLHALVAEDEQPIVWESMGSPEQWGRLSEEGQQRLARIRSVLLNALALRGRVALRDCVERTWHALGGPATVDNTAALQDARAYLDRLQQIERAGDLQDTAKLESQLDELYATSNPAERVELMTIHRAKGLEFDVVILPGLDRGGRSDDSPLLRAQVLSPPNREHALLLAPINARGSDKDSIYQWMEDAEKERARLEKSRVLYVAVTRAERELHLFGAVDTKDNQLCKPAAGTFLHLLWQALEQDFATKLAASSHAASSASAEMSDIRSTEVYTRRLPLDWQPPPPHSRDVAVTITDIVENQPLLPEFQWAGEVGRQVGTLVHREMERIANLGLANIDAQSIRANRQHYEAGLAELGIPPGMRHVAAQRVIDALENLLHDSRGHWLLAGNDVHLESASEFALSGLIGTELVNIVIDRTLVDRNNIRWIIDYKTSSHEGGGLEQFLDNEVQRYRSQLQRYAQLMRGFDGARAIKAALYFPLLGVWREVEI